MNIDEKISLITRNCEEVLTDEDLRRLIISGTPLRHYIGLEISGKVHLGTGLMCMGKIADFLKAGVECQIFLADFHSYLNNKLDGTWETIRRVSDDYFKEALTASLACYGVKAGEVYFVSGKELYQNNLVHWETFMEVGRHLTLSRNLRSISIMGKKQGQQVNMATLFYPPLQVADIFTLKVNLAHAGMDQRKAHVVARQVAKKLKINPLKDKKGKVIAPVAVHQNLIAGLGSPQEGQGGEDLKMSKSKPESAVFIHDSPQQIREKIEKAYCPPQDTEYNPMINWVEYLVFWGGKEGEFIVNRPAKFGGKKVYRCIDTLIQDYQTGALYPQDLKNAVADWLIAKLEPARRCFEKPKIQEGLRFLEKIVNG